MQFLGVERRKVEFLLTERVFDLRREVVAEREVVRNADDPWFDGPEVAVASRPRKLVQDVVIDADAVDLVEFLVQNIENALVGYPVVQIRSSGP